MNDPKQAGCAVAFPPYGLPKKAAEIKATHPVFLADAWIAACAVMENGTLVHKDLEFSLLTLEQFALPFKK